MHPISTIEGWREIKPQTTIKHFCTTGRLEDVKWWQWGSDLAVFMWGDIDLFQLVFWKYGVSAEVYCWCICCETKENVHEVLVKTIMGRKRAAKSGGMGVQGLVREVRCIWMYGSERIHPKVNFRPVGLKEQGENLKNQHGFMKGKSCLSSTAAFG